MPTYDSDKVMTISGVDGRLTHRTTKPGQKPGLWFKQRWISRSRPFKYYDEQAHIQTTIRFDDQCGNSHNSFAMTADIYIKKQCVAGGCCHEDIAKAFPELAPLIKWHLTSSDGPMHYIANTVYHAGNRDHNGLLKDEARQIINGRTKEPCWELVPSKIVDGKPIPLHSLQKYRDSATQPTEIVTLTWQPWNRIGEGKERDFDAARSCAVWPDATDHQLSLPKAELAKLLEDRHELLMAEFKRDITATGFLWTPESVQ